MSHIRLCPQCGSLNPIANSRCVQCKREMTADAVEIPKVQREEPGYQPPLEPQETVFLSIMSFYTAIAMMVGTIRGGARLGRITEEELNYCLDRHRDTTMLLLHNRFGRTPTRDEVETLVVLTAGLDGAGEMISRLMRILENSPDAHGPETDSVIRKQYELQTKMPRFMEIMGKALGDS